MKRPEEENRHEKLPHPPKTGVKHASHAAKPSGSASSMQALSLFKGRTLIGFALVPEGEDHSHPDVGQSPAGHAMTLALGPFALIIRFGPRLVASALPGELIQGVAQGFEAGEAHMNGRILPAFPGHRTGSGQRLNASGFAVAGAIVSPFGQQPGSQALASTGQTFKDRAVGMGQKKVSDGLIIFGNLLDQGQQLLNQGQGEPRFGTRCDLIGLQMRLIQQGHTVFWTSTSTLVQRLLVAKRELRLPQEIARLQQVSCLILDDLGYVQQDRDEMEVLFTLLAPRYP